MGAREAHLGREDDSMSTTRVTERDLYDRLRGRLKDIHWQRVETTTGSGVPDVNGCHAGAEFWVECKVTHGWSLVIRDSQTAWITRRVGQGGRVRVAVWQSGMDRNDLWIVPGSAILVLAQVGLRIDSDLLLGHWGSGPGGWAWSEIRAALTSDRL